jgi:hypothetical protein
MEVDFCPRHLKMVTSKTPICEECLKEKGYRTLENQDGIFINSADLLKLFEIKKDFRELERSYEDYVSVIVQLINYSKKLQNVKKNFKATNETDHVIIRTIEETSKAIGEEIENFIESYLEEIN